MYVLGFDLETTGLNVEKDEIIEIGAVLWDSDRGVPLAIQSDLIYKEGLEVPKEITEITGIDTRQLQYFGIPIKDALKNFVKLISHAQYVVAHNGKNFDEPFLRRVAKETEVELTPTFLIDTSIDIPFPKRITTRKLTYLAAEHGFVNPFAHRAIFDVLTMLTVAQNYDWGLLGERSQMPEVEVRAVVSFDDKEKAKAKGYWWDKKRSYWVKNIKQCDFKDEVESADFTVKRL